MAVSKEDIRTAWLELMDEYSSSLETGEGSRGVELLTIDKIYNDGTGNTENALTRTLSLPGVIFNVDPVEHPDATAQYYVQFPFSVLAVVLDDLRENVENSTSLIQQMTSQLASAEVAIPRAENAAAMVDAALDNVADVIDNEQTRISNETDRQNAETSRVNEFGNIKGEWGDNNSGLKKDIITATNNANAAATAAAGADKVNAQLVGMTVTITNRQGQSTSFNLGFEIYRTYSSVSAMNADAANVPDGKFVMIATTSATDPENARLYGKNSMGGFTFLSDLDQASSSAWADWLENMKPEIQGRIDTADADHTQATSDHTQASQDHTTAYTDHATAQSDHTTAQSDHTRAETDHTTASQDHSVAQSDHNTASDDHEIADDDHDVYVSDHSTASDDHDTAVEDSSQAASDHTRAESDHSTAVSDHTTASSDHTNALADTSQASTDHSTATDDHAQAVLDSTQAGTDHTQATSDHTMAENDHSQAVTDSGVAADDHTLAVSDHTTASSDHTVATTDHSTAESDHTRAEGDHTTATTDHTQADTDHTASVTATQYANEQGDYAKDWNDHPPFIGNGTTGDLNYWYIYDITTEQYVRAAYAKGDNLDWDNMTPAEKQRLIDEVLQSLEDYGFDAVPTEGSAKPVRSGGIYTALQAKQDSLTFASDATCESIIDELL